jgi:hypothetical protein
MAKSKAKTSHPKKGLDNKALIEGEGEILNGSIAYLFYHPHLHPPPSETVSQLGEGYQVE